MNAVVVLSCRNKNMLEEEKRGPVFPKKISVVSQHSSRTSCPEAAARLRVPVRAAGAAGASLPVTAGSSPRL